MVLMKTKDKDNDKEVKEDSSDIVSDDDDKTKHKRL